jgi:hypothetical protein
MAAHPRGSASETRIQDRDGWLGDLDAARSTAQSSRAVVDVLAPGWLDSWVCWSRSVRRAEWLHERAYTTNPFLNLSIENSYYYCVK